MSGLPCPWPDQLYCQKCEQKGGMQTQTVLLQDDDAAMPTESRVIASCGRCGYHTTLSVRQLGPS